VTPRQAVSLSPSAASAAVAAAPWRVPTDQLGLAQLLQLVIDPRSSAFSAKPWTGVQQVGRYRCCERTAGRGGGGRSIAEKPIWYPRRAGAGRGGCIVVGVAVRCRASLRLL